MRHGFIFDQAEGHYTTWEEAVQAIVDRPHMRPLHKDDAMCVIGANNERFPLDFIKGMVGVDYDL